MLRYLRSAVNAVDHFVPSALPRTKPLVNLARHLGASSLSLTKDAFAFSQISNFSTNAATRQPQMLNSFTYSARSALQRPTAFRLPRAPALPRNISQVGLGTARNFSSSRQVFQSLAENVPISVRTMMEAEFDLKRQKKFKKRNARKSKSSIKTPSKMKPSNPTVSEVASVLNGSVEFDQYFAIKSFTHEENVTCTLTVPLYPQQVHPQRRRPLPSVDNITLFSVPDVREVHNDHQLHSIRVSSLFSRLDSAGVWNKGVSCNCYGEGSNGLVSSLEVVFQGWSKPQVQKVIGEAGLGWCELSESRRPIVDPQTTFIMPTLDFSATFATQAGSPPFSTSPSCESFTSFQDVGLFSSTISEAGSLLLDHHSPELMGLPDFTVHSSDYFTSFGLSSHL